MRRAWITLLSILVPSASWAQPDTLSVLDATGFPGETMDIRVSLANRARIAGTQIGLLAEGGGLAWEGVRVTDRAEGMSLYTRIASDTLKIILLDPGRRSGILPGSGPLLVVQARAREGISGGAVRVVEARLSDDGHPPAVRVGETRPGRFEVAAVQLSLRSWEGSWQVVVTSPERLTAAQFDLTYDASVVLPPETRVAPGWGGLSAFASPVSAGKTRVVLADVRGNEFIPAGRSAVVEATFRLRGGPRRDSVFVDLSAVVAVNAGGRSLSSAGKGGWVRIARPPVPRVVIDEILSSPADGPAGDANGDGVRDAYHDEFVEIVNADSMAVDIGGWTLSDDDETGASRFEFPRPTTLQPGGRATLFGGGSPRGVPGMVFSDDGRIGDGLANGGERLLLMDAGGDTVSVAAVGPADGESLVRSGDGGFVRHASWPGRGLCSPGRPRPTATGLTVSPESLRVATGQSASLEAVALFSDGVSDTLRTGVSWRSESQALATVTPAGRVTGVRPGRTRISAEVGGLVSAGTVSVELAAPPSMPAGPATVPGGSARLSGDRPRLVIDEILAAPAEGPAGDANGDGMRDTYQDEFVEILNEDSHPVDLEGWTLSDDDATLAGRFRFPGGAILEPGARAVLFGGGHPSAIPGLVFTDDGRIGDGLSNAGDRVLLLDGSSGDTLAAASFGSSSGQSLVRNPDGSYSPHGAWPAMEPFSPGRPRPTVSGIQVRPERVTIWIGQHALLRIVAVFTDGRMDTVRTGIVWDSLPAGVVAIDGSGLLTALRTGQATVKARIGDMFGRGEVRVEDPPNRPPILTPAALRHGHVSAPFRDRIEARDPDGDRVTLSVAEGPFWIRIDAQTGVLEGTAGPSPEESSVLVRAEDGRGGWAEGRYRLSILPRVSVVVDEVLLAPPEGPEGDANGDGNRDGYEDEFVEILNVDSMAVSIAGWALGDDDTPDQRRFRLPSGTLLSPGERAVLFGGGRPRGIAGKVFADDGRIGDGLSNTGERVLLLDEAGDTIDAVAVPRTDGQSCVRTLDGRGTFAPHTQFPGRGRFSPGRPRALLTSLAASVSDLPLRSGEDGGLRASARFTDGQVEDVSGRVTWEIGDTSVARLAEGVRLRGLTPGSTSLVARWGYAASPPLRVDVLPSTNRPPVVGDLRDTAVLEDSPLRLRVKASDPDGDPLWFSLIEGPRWLRIDSRTGWLSALPGDDEVGKGEVLVEVSDGRSGIRKGFRLTVRNRAPAFVSPPRGRAWAGLPYRDTLHVDNLDGGHLMLAQAPAWLSLEGAILRGSPNTRGMWHGQLTAIDPHGGEATLSWEIVSVSSRDLVVDELMADPPEGPDGDLNGDGRRDGYEDEFVELLNRGDSAIDLAELRLGPEGTPATRFFRFPEGALLPPGARALVFGGGNPGAFPCAVYTAGGRLGRGLPADGGGVLLVDATGPDTLLRETYPAGAHGVSWAWSRQGGTREGAGVEGAAEAFLPHDRLPGTGRYSPGLARSLLTGLEVVADSALGVGRRGTLRAVGQFDDGGRHEVTDQVAFWVSDSSVLQLEPKGRITGRMQGTAQVIAAFGTVGAGTEIRVVGLKSHKGLALEEDREVGGEDLGEKQGGMEAERVSGGPLGIRPDPSLELGEPSAGGDSPQAGTRDLPVLSANSPNPFHGTTVFHCRSPTEGSAAVYNLLGQRVRFWTRVGAGPVYSAVRWDGRDESGNPLPSGVYFLVFQAGGARLVRRMALVR